MLATLLPPVDRAVLTGERAAAREAKHRPRRRRSGIAGWRDDDLAFTQPWGFELADIRVPALLWQGVQDKMVPVAHGRWLAERIPGVEAHISEPDGHLSIAVGRLGEILDWLAARSGGPSGAAAKLDLEAMDVLVLIDKLDDLVHNAKAVPLTDQVRIDREEIYDILDQMRATIPEEIKQARWIVKERQEMLAEAKREVDRLLAEAREQAVREASQTEIVKIAERQAQDIVDEARREAREARLEMEDWADSMLASLEVNLDRFLTAVSRGRERLHERSQETVVGPASAR